MINSPFPLLYEDNHLLVIDKPAGVLSQGDHTGDRDVIRELKSFLKRREHKPGNVYLGLPHRLDRPVSGVLLLAKTSKALKRITALFRDRTGIEKIYWAVVNGHVPQASDTLVHYLTKDRQKNVTTAYDHCSNGTKRAELRYEIAKTLSKQLTLLKVFTLTGRPHQIRVQLAKAGVPIEGDLKYGASRPCDDGNILLHARSLRFIHPVKKTEIYIEAPLPHRPAWQNIGI